MVKCGPPSYANVAQPEQDVWTWSQAFSDVEGDWSGGVEVKYTRPCKVTLDAATGMLWWTCGQSCAADGGLGNHRAGVQNQPLRHFSDMAPFFGFDVPLLVKAALQAARRATATVGKPKRDPGAPEK